MAVNPYSNHTFFSSLKVLFLRIFQAIQGNLSLVDLASDENQLLTLSFVAISAGLVGTFLILRRQTMMANALSHTILVGIVLAYFFDPARYFGAQISPFGQTDMGIMMASAVITGAITAFLTEILT